MTAQATTNPLSTAVQFHGYHFPLEEVPCDFCSGSDFYPFWDRMRHGLNLRTVFCKQCGLCMTNPRPTAEANHLFYSQLYNHFHKRETPLAVDNPYVVKSRKLAMPRVDCLAQFLNPRESISVFEIGAGVGQFQVAAAERTKWQVSGLEPGNEQSALCQRLGLKVQQAFFQSLEMADESHDAVVSFHVFEHVDSPAQFLRHVNRILKPNGLLHLEVPNLGRFGAGGLDEFLQFPHLFNFTAATLRNYVTAVGGLKPIFTAERYQSLTMIARKVGPATAEPPRAGDFERYDVVNFMQRLRMLQRLHKLARWIPTLPVLGKIRSTLDTV